MSNNHLSIVYISAKEFDLARTSSAKFPPTNKAFTIGRVKGQEEDNVLFHNGLLVLFLNRVASYCFATDAYGREYFYYMYWFAHPNPDVGSIIDHRLLELQDGPVPSLYNEYNAYGGKVVKDIFSQNSRVIHVDMFYYDNYIYMYSIRKESESQDNATMYCKLKVHNFF